MPTSQPYRALVLTITAMFVLLGAIPAGAQVVGTGTVSGRITSNGSPVPQGVADFYAWPEYTYVDSAFADTTGAYTLTGLEPGLYLVDLGNADLLTFAWSDFFPETWEDAPYLREDLATIIEVPDGGTISGINADLEPFYSDMSDGPFGDDIAWCSTPPSPPAAEAAHTAPTTL